MTDILDLLIDPEGADRLDREAEAAATLIVQHRSAAETTGVVAADTLFNMTGGREMSGEDFDAYMRSFGEQFVKLYRAPDRDPAIYTDSFIRLMIQTGAEACFSRLAKLIDRAGPTPSEQGRAN